MPDVKCPACGTAMETIDGLVEASYQSCPSCGFDRLLTARTDDDLLAIWSGEADPEPFVESDWTFTHTLDADGVLTTTMRRITHA